MVADVDYNPDGPLTVMFAMGSGNGTVENAMITAVNDMDVEGDHEFTVSIQSTSPPATLGTSSMTATIMDDDRKFDYDQRCKWMVIIIKSGQPSGRDINLTCSVQEKSGNSSTFVCCLGEWVIPLFSCCFHSQSVML